jgi:heme O synthase-like polyprenyltransferase
LNVFLSQHIKNLKAAEFFISQHSGFPEKAFLSYNCFEVKGLNDSLNIILSLFFLSFQAKIFVKKYKRSPSLNMFKKSVVILHTYFLIARCKSKNKHFCLHLGAKNE